MSLKNYTGLAILLVTGGGHESIEPDGLIRSEVQPSDKAQHYDLESGNQIPIVDAIDGLFISDSGPAIYDDLLLLDKETCERMAEKGHDGFLFYPGERDEMGQVLNLCRFVREDQEYPDPM